MLSLRPTAALRLAAVLLVAGFVAVPATAFGAVPASASRASGHFRGEQLVVVTAPSYQATYARLTAYQWNGRRWSRVMGPLHARIGYNGMAPPGRKREGDGRTPSGTYGFGFFFGVLANPGVAFPFRRVHRSDVWDDDPASPRYNEWVDRLRHNPGRSPEPMYQVPAYDYGAVIGYNTARVPGLGSAIFLHVGTGTATAGCVSLPVRNLLRVLRWLRPAGSPRIRMQAR